MLESTAKRIKVSSNVTPCIVCDTTNGNDSLAKLCKGNIRHHADVVKLGKNC